MTAAEQTGAAKDQNVEQQITALNDEVVQAYLKGDTNLLQKYFADDVTIIHGDGKLITKAEEIENFTSGALKFESIEVRESKVLVYGDTKLPDCWRPYNTQTTERQSVGMFATFVFG